MNRYLLDTHILLWWLSNDKKLSAKIKKVIADPKNQIMVSAVTIWEISIKKSLNKLKAPDNLKEVLLESDFKVLPMTIDHALGVETLPAFHNDPFDRLLVAQCMIEDLTLITCDKIMPEYNIAILKT